MNDKPLTVEELTRLGFTNISLYGTKHKKVGQVKECYLILDGDVRFEIAFYHAPTPAELFKSIADKAAEVEHEACSQQLAALIT